MFIIKRLDLEVLDVYKENKDDPYFLVEDTEGHVCTVEMDGDYLVITQDNWTKESIHKKQENLIMYSVLSALDYHFE